jgi:raffinose/stachyose/melibiose transport system substrate-binding protein
MRHEGVLEDADDLEIHTHQSARGRNSEMNDPATLTRRRFLAGAGLTALGLALPDSLLAACGGSSSSTSGGNATLKFWMDVAGAKNQDYFKQHVITPFESQSKTKLDVTYYSGADLRRLIQTALQAKSGPDIVRGLSASQDLAWTKSNLLVDLDKYAPSGGWKSKIATWAMTPFTVKGKTYALPMREDTMLMYYNKTLFEQKNWKPPTNRSELEALATEAKGQGLIPLGGTNSTYGASSEWLVTVFWNHFAGPQALHQALTGKLPWTDPVFVDAIDLLASYFKKGWVGGSTAKYYSVPQATIGSQFGKGQVALYPNGEWFMAQLDTYFGKAANNDNDWDWAPLPSLSSDVPYGLFEVGVGGSYGVSAASKYPDQAAKFLQWYYGDKKTAVQRMAGSPSTYNIPIPLQKGDLPSSMDARSSRLLTSVQDALTSGKFGYVTWTWWGPKSDTFIYQGVDKVLNGKMTSKEYCSQLNDIFQQELKEGNVPTTLEPKPQKI